jgi:hypothetical protein
MQFTRYIHHIAEFPQIFNNFLHFTPFPQTMRISPRSGGIPPGLAALAPLVSRWRKAVRVDGDIVCAKETSIF